MITEILKRIFGDKSTKDQKLYQPYVDQVLAAEQVIQGFNDDELREKSFTFRTQIKNSIAAKEAELASTEQQAASLDVEINEKEELFERIDRLRAEIDGLIEEELLKILPEAFAVVKETAKRWANNGQLTVKARDFDRALAAKKDGIELQGDQAIWRNEWTAAGNKVLWNMVHYDVQLMGGAVLHKGNIAEMQTGEGKTLVATLPVY